MSFPALRTSCLFGVLWAAAAIAAPRFWFDDASARSGITAENVFGPKGHKNWLSESIGNGVALIDFDGDGWLDVFLVNGSRYEGFQQGREPTNHLYRNKHDGTFEDVTSRSGLARPGWGAGVCAGDFDNDGRLDLFVTYYGANRLYHNLGQGRFADIAASAGLAAEPGRWSTGCSFLDYDKDGDVDLFVTHYAVLDRDSVPPGGSPRGCTWKGLPVFCGPRGITPERNQLFQNNGNRTFSDVSKRTGVVRDAPTYGLGVLTLDADNDGWPDIYVACDSVASQFFHNRGDGTFEEIGVETGLALSNDGNEQAGMGVAAGDYNRDGFLDIFKTNFSDDLPNLYRNNGDGTFTDEVSLSGPAFDRRLLGWGAVFGDFDNDGYLDLFEVNGHVYSEVSLEHQDTTFLQPRTLYRNLHDGRFEKVGEEAGPAVAERHSGRGVAVGDLNNDGALDLVINNLNEKPTVLLGRPRPSANWLSLRLRGVKSNRSAIGARVNLYSSDGAQIREVTSGGSFLSQNDLRLHFGLGRATSIDKIVVCWPNSRPQTLRGIGVNSFLSVAEGDKEPSVTSAERLP